MFEAFHKCVPNINTQVFLLDIVYTCNIKEGGLKLHYHTAKLFQVCSKHKWEF